MAGVSCLELHFHKSVGLKKTESSVCKCNCVASFYQIPRASLFSIHHTIQIPISPKSCPSAVAFNNKMTGFTILCSSFSLSQTHYKTHDEGQSPPFHFHFHTSVCCCGFHVFPSLLGGSSYTAL